MVGPPGVQFLAMVALLDGGQDRQNELVAALSDLASHLFRAAIVAELDHRFVPGDRVKIDGVEQRAVQVEDGCCCKRPARYELPACSTYDCAHDIGVSRP
jgi:hypothetical protein